MLKFALLKCLPNLTKERFKIRSGLQGANEIHWEICSYHGSDWWAWRAAAQRFYDEGANIVLVDLHQNDIDAFLQTFDTDTKRIIGIEADVSKDADVKNYVNETMAVFGRIDTLFNNAGIEGSISSLKTMKKRSLTVLCK